MLQTLSPTILIINAETPSEKTIERLMIKTDSFKKLKITLLSTLKHFFKLKQKEDEN